MAIETLEALLHLPPGERARLAVALWESLEESQRDDALSLTPEQAEVLEQRLSAHQADPSSAIAWNEVRRKLAGRA